MSRRCRAARSKCGSLLLLPLERIRYAAVAAQPDAQIYIESPRPHCNDAQHAYQQRIAPPEEPHGVVRLEHRVQRQNARGPHRLTARAMRRTELEHTRRMSLAGEAPRALDPDDVAEVVVPRLGHPPERQCAIRLACLHTVEPRGVHPLVLERQRQSQRRVGFARRSARLARVDKENVLCNERTQRVIVILVIRAVQRLPRSVGGDQQHGAFSARLTGVRLVRQWVALQHPVEARATHEVHHSGRVRSLHQLLGRDAKRRGDVHAVDQVYGARVSEQIGLRHLRDAGVVRRAHLDDVVTRAYLHRFVHTGLVRGPLVRKRRRIMDSAQGMVVKQGREVVACLGASREPKLDDQAQVVERSIGRYEVGGAWRSTELLLVPGCKGHIRKQSRILRRCLHRLHHLARRREHTIGQVDGRIRRNDRVSAHRKPAERPRRLVATVRLGDRHALGCAAEAGRVQFGHEQVPHIRGIREHSAAQEMI